VSRVAPTVSLVIVAKNEERTIGSVIDAARPLVDEILVVDSGSTDSTIALCEERGARVIHQDWLGYARQKNFALELATKDWILSLDADEILTPALVQEITQLKQSPLFEKFDGYKLPRVLYIGDTPVKHGGFYPDAQLRLFKRGKGHWGERLVHEAIKMEGPVTVLKNHMDHYSYKTVDDFANAMDKYARLSAQEFYNRGDAKVRSSLVKELFSPTWSFIYRYVGRAGFMDGALGLKLATIYADYVRNKVRYLRELVKSR
jgi:glycosyltransferase involved in cell wall biosynthesis